MIQSVPPRLYADLIGKPFAREGRGPCAYDCLGLGMELQRRRGLILPAYLSDEAELHRAIAAGGTLEDANRIGQPEAGCVVLMHSDVGPGRHIGTMTDPFRMLHTYESLGSAVHEVLHRSVFRARVIGFYRLAGDR